MKNRVWFALFALCIPSLCWADKTWVAGKKSSVEFVSKITGGSFTTSTNNIQGTIVTDDSGKKIISANLSVPVESLDSGMSMRNDHMQNKFLEAKTYPNISFAVTNADISKDGINSINGKFTIKAKTNDVALEAKIERSSDKLTKLSSEFPINITEYGIAQPTYLVVSMDPVVKLRVKLVLEPKS